MSPAYCLDSGVFINSWTKNYPIDVFPCVWECIGELCASGIAVIPQLVYDEIQVKADGLFDWLKPYKSAVVQPDEKVLLTVKQILRTHPRLLDNKRGRSGADPFVIAHASVSQLIVITEEQETRGQSPRIPDVCKDIGVPYMRTMELLRSCSLRAVASK